MEPISATIITALVGLYTAYTTCKVGMAQAQAQGNVAPVLTPEAERGQQVAAIVEAGVQQHGTDDEKADLASFKRNPQRYEALVQHLLADLAQREPAFNQQLQHVAAQTNVAQTGGIHGEATVAGNTSGMNVGVSTGTIIQSSQTINNSAPSQGAQGIFHAPVNIDNTKER